ncbi:hypothetical protein VTK73DRAFT_3494 [Phialemonium thermophilum]|uniref:Copper-fist domain-containing protein n=1 Tax=Phialemonium thermophilum TaxID=223376 RepID=A0ABR3WYU5_9PEZI
MLINGEKWACEACVRGHRVSNCQHSDRPLQHINKKGRPVSQCQHCRAMRKSRAAHTKCDCGEKTQKCAHLRPTVEGHKESCCCNHGGRCTCAHKKEILHLDPVPESDSEKDPAARVKNAKAAAVRGRRRANTIHSEGTLAFDANGHHKPAHKLSRASQKSGPYQISRMNTVPGAGSFGNRSADNLFRLTNNPGEIPAVDSPASSGGSIAEQQQAKSEAASPLMTGSTSFSELGNHPLQLDLSNIEYPSYSANGFDNPFSGLPDHEQPIYSAGLSVTPVDWSHFDGLDFAGKTPADLAPSSYSQPQSFGAFDINGLEQPPTWTTNTSTSGDASELEDLQPNSLDDFEEPRFGTSTTSSGFDLAQMHATIIGGADVSSLSYDDFKLIKAGTKFLPTPASLAGEEPILAATNSAAISNFALDDDASLWMSDYSHGLPGMPGLTDSPDLNVRAFWES